MITGSISSLQNPRVQEARKLRRRSVRDQSGSFLIEGGVAVAEALDAGDIVNQIYVSNTDEHRASVERAERDDIRVDTVSEPVLKAISDAATPQGIVAVGKMRDVSLEALLADADLLLVLAEVRDPGNAGTLVRSAVAAGATGVVFTQGATDPFGPKTVRATAGTLFRTKITRGIHLPDALQKIGASGLKLVGADAGADQTVDVTDLTPRLALVLGNESWGLPEGLRGMLDEVVAIRMPGPAESLNVGIAGSILLFECVRQRSQRASER